MRILIIEDEERIANTIKKGLVQERYAVDIANDGLTGYDLASTENYDCMVIDLMLPGMDGITICQKLRDNDITTPILILTAKSQTHEKILGLDSGADDYLAKPFSFDELVARIRALTRRPKGFAKEIISVHDLTMDTKKFTFMYKNMTVNLSHKEFAVVHYLMKNAGNVLTKDQIISHVWDFDANILPNTVEVTIGNVRKKIEKVTGTKDATIRAVRGFGYIIDK